MTSASAALELPYLRALFEQHASIDCWCGYAFGDVVASYVLDPTDPTDPEFLENAERKEYPELAKAAALTPDAREAGLLADVKRVLSEVTCEEARREVLVAAGGETVLEFTEFWSPTGDAYEGDGAATLFLVLLQRYAAGARIQTGPFDMARSEQILADAKREAARLV